MISPYNDITEETRNKIMLGRDSWYTNKVYKNSEYNFYWYINSKGYIHVLRPSKVSINGSIIYYSIDDSMLTKNNMLKQTALYGNFKSLQDCIQAIEKKE